MQGTAPIASTPLDIHTIGSVHHDLGDVRVVHQVFQRAEADDVVDERVEDHVRRFAVGKRGFVAQQLREMRTQLVAAQRCGIERGREQPLLQRRTQ